MDKSVVKKSYFKLKNRAYDMFIAFDDRYFLFCGAEGPEQTCRVSNRCMVPVVPKTRYDSLGMQPYIIVCIYGIGWRF